MKTITGKKVLFVITKSNWGGAQQYVYTLATRLAEAGADIAVALGGTGEAGAKTGLLETRLAEAGIRTIFLSAFARDIGVIREHIAFFELLRILHQGKPDILHLNSSKAGGLGALAGRIAGVRKIVFTAHGWAHGESRPWYERSIIWIISWLTAQLCHRIITVSEYDLQHAPILFSQRKMNVVRNGISTFPLLPYTDARNAFIKEFPTLVKFPFWFFSLCELHPNKGLDTLIRAFSTIAKTQKDTALILVGSGALRTALEELARSLSIADRVFFTGFVKDARTLLSAVDVFILSSRKEGLPFAILEAGIARLPVIATQVGAVSEIVEHEISGILIPKEQPRELARAMITMKNSPAQREKMAHALHARIIRDFSEEMMVEKTIDTYL